MRFVFHYFSSREKKLKRKFTFFGKYQNYFNSGIENIRNSIREFTDIFITFDEIYLVFTQKGKCPLFIA